MSKTFEQEFQELCEKHNVVIEHDIEPCHNPYILHNDDGLEDQYDWVYGTVYARNIDTGEKIAIIIPVGD